ncbi:MAG: hypothetical protein ACFFDF_16805 [Candidatus Odinarchaeota archaeon]
MKIAENRHIPEYPTNKINSPQVSILIKKFLLSIHINGIFSDQWYRKNPNNAIGVYGIFTPDVRLFIGGLNL